MAKSVRSSRFNLKTPYESTGEILFFNTLTGAFSAVEVTHVPSSGHRDHTTPKSPELMILASFRSSNCRSLGAVSALASNASTAILCTMADAGRERSATRPASSRERVGHVLTCNVMGRFGMGVGFHAARW